MWDAIAQRLLFVDIPTGRLFSHDPRNGRTSTTEFQHELSYGHPAVGGGLVVAVREGVAMVRDGSLRMLAAPLAESPGARMNDANVDPRGRLLVGTMAYDFADGAGRLYRLDTDGQLTTVLTDVTISNGIDWSPDGATAYYVDSPTLRIDTFDYDLDAGELSRRREFATIEDGAGLPDGLTVDAEGGVWVALYGGGQVRRFTAAGALDLIVEVPGARLVTSCCFGGPELDQLYISTSRENLTAEQLRSQPGAGHIFSARTGHRGRPVTLFGASASGPTIQEGV
ncbi:SMP-30/gluconolactonase/LRE family protein [Jiangella endophytica]|uniref:SMP-30/gluconolactonase/LRE family protein n=1 Tax=Jiangella endophytica TaxID=1623398 RepID=UPI0018E56DE3|nr:SMP-30/gluconolactonase/LRE family protein [Jiangella endophytica]